MTGKIFVISASSGAGKTTLVNEVVKRLSPHYALERVVTYTSRAPRSGEKNGWDYHFISEKEFEVKIQEGFFLEYSTVYGTYYGSPAHFVDRVNQGISFFLILDINGVEQIVSKLPNLVLIWITVDIDVLRERLMIRNSETSEQVEQRLLLAQKESEQKCINSLYNYQIFNNNLKKSILTFQSLVKKLIEKG